MLLALLAIVAGLILLTKTADVFVAGAARLSVALNIPRVVIGAVVVGFGTSAPEMVVSGIAAGQGKLDIAVGNVIGSNVANLSLVLGVAALMCTMTVSSSVLRREAPLSTASVILFALLVQGGLERWEGVVLAVAMVAALWRILAGASDDGDGELVAEVEEFLEGEADTPVAREAVLTLAGLSGVIVAAQLTVWGASTVAEELGLGEGFIAVTLIALGTSLPELTTAITAARKGEHELIIGNLLGSNVFNSLTVGAVAGLVGPGTLDDPNLASIGVGAMVLIALAAWWFMHSGRRISNWEAVSLLAGYVVTVPLLA